MLVHIPVEWDVSKPVRVSAVTAFDAGVRVDRDLVLWSPLGFGPSLLLDRHTGREFRVTEDGLAETAFSMSPEIRPGFGVARAVRTLMAAALAAAPETALAA